MQKALGGPSRKSRRRGARLKPGASAELANLFSQQQVCQSADCSAPDLGSCKASGEEGMCSDDERWLQALSVQLEQLRRSRLGGGSTRAWDDERDLGEDDDDDFSDEEP